MSGMRWALLALLLPNLALPFAYGQSDRPGAAPIARLNTGFDFLFQTLAGRPEKPLPPGTDSLSLNWFVALA